MFPNVTPSSLVETYEISEEPAVSSLSVETMWRHQFPLKRRPIYSATKLYGITSEISILETTNRSTPLPWRWRSHVLSKRWYYQITRLFYIILKMEAVEIYETLSIYQSAWRLILTKRTINSPCYKNFKSLIVWTGYPDDGWKKFLRKFCTYKSRRRPISRG